MSVGRTNKPVRQKAACGRVLSSNTLIAKAYRGRIARILEVEGKGRVCHVEVVPVHLEPCSILQCAQAGANLSFATPSANAARSAVDTYMAQLQLNPAQGHSARPPRVSKVKKSLCAHHGRHTDPLSGRPFSVNCMLSAIISSASISAAGPAMYPSRIG